MSMISSQIDELRQMADGQVTYRDARVVMLQAADTIWQLRDDLQRANAENAKLRKEFDKMDKWHSAELTAAMDENAKLVDVLHEVETEAVYAYRCLQQDCVTAAESSERFFKKWWHAECMNDNRLKRIDQLEAENAKLRELVADYFNAPCVECNPWDEGWKGCKHCDSGNCNLAVRALKLGIEVEQ